MPTVPGKRSSVVPLGKPDDVDYMMALATMQKLGRFADRLDPIQTGQVEDRRQDEDELAAQTAAARRIRGAVQRPRDEVMDAFEAMKAKRR